jgi:Flp pilus assembly protein TadG
MKRFMRERGQSLVELGVSLLILLYLLSGAAEFGVLFFQFVQLRDAAQEGALYGSMNPWIDSAPPSAYADGKFEAGEAINQAGIEARVRAASATPIDLTNADPATGVTVTVSSADGSNLFCEGHGLQVTVSYHHKIFMPFIPRLIGNTEIPLTATVVDTILTPLCGP